MPQSTAQDCGASFYGSVQGLYSRRSVPAAKDQEIAHTQNHVNGSLERILGMHDILTNVATTMPWKHWSCVALCCQQHNSFVQHLRCDWPHQGRCWTSGCDRLIDPSHQRQRDLQCVTCSKDFCDECATDPRRECRDSRSCHHGQKPSVCKSRTCTPWVQWHRTCNTQRLEDELNELALDSAASLRCESCDGMICATCIVGDTGTPSHFCDMCNRIVCAECGFGDRPGYVSQSVMCDGCCGTSLCLPCFYTGQSRRLLDFYLPSIELATSLVELPCIGQQHTAKSITDNPSWWTVCDWCHEAEPEKFPLNDQANASVLEDY